MTKLEQSIKELCPNGVEHRRVGDCIRSLKTGLNPRKNFILNEPENTIPYVTGKDVYNNKINVSERTDKISAEALVLINKRANLESDLLLFASTGTGTVGRMAVIEKYDNNWGISETLYAMKPNKDILLTKYLMHVLYSSIAKNQYEPKISRGSVPHLKVSDLLNVNIPVPPIPVQMEIVRILNDLSEKTEKLIFKLNAELDERKKQHEHYQLLLLGQERNSVYPKKNIPEIAETFIGLVTTMTKHYVDNGVLLIHNSDIKKGFFSFKKPTYLNVDFANKNSNRMHKKDDVITVHTGDVGTSAIIDEKLEGSLGFATIVSRIHNKSEVLPQWLCHYLNSSICKQQISTLIKGDRNNLNLKDFNKIYIYIPPIAEQISIIDQLDKIEETYNSIIKNIEEEKDLRQKQYEYYRDKLLTF